MPLVKSILFISKSPEGIWLSNRLHLPPFRTFEQHPSYHPCSYCQTAHDCYSDHALLRYFVVDEALQARRLQIRWFVLQQKLVIPSSFRIVA